MKKIKIFMLMICLIMCFSSITFAANFYDTKGTKYEGVVDRIARLGVINGISEKAFAPNKSITRAELAKMIIFTRGLKDYADTSNLKANFSDTKGHWAESYIAAAEDLGIMNGYNDGTFKPDEPVSYAEVVAIILRGLGYVNIDETSGSTWYSGYIKRMFEIELDEGVEEYNSYEDPIKRGDVAMLWWNMLVSDRWVVDYGTDLSGLHYTYSLKTQLEVLFPDFSVINGRITSIANGSESDTIEVRIENRDYDTDSEVPIYAIGAVATGVCDKESNAIYGLSIDDELVEHKLVSGPIFYLESQGYNLKKSKYEAVLGSKTNANFAYLFVSKENGEILRSVLVDATNSYYVESVKVETEKSDKDDEDDESTRDFAKIFLNDSEEHFTTNDAVVIKNGKKVEWNDVEEGMILTELIPGKLFTYEDKIINGSITDYSKLNELYIDGDKYIVSPNCLYSVYGEKIKGDDEKTKSYSYDDKMNKIKLEELLARNTEFYLNTAEEISFIKFGKYLSNNMVEKYDNSNYSFFYITSLTYSSGDDTMNVGGRSLTGKHLKYYLPPSDDFEVGDFVVVSGIDGKNAEDIELIKSNKMYEDSDISVIYDCEYDFYNNAFGEYYLVDDTVIFRVDIYYENNSTDEIEEHRITELANINQLEDLSKYKINLLCNNDMEIEVIFAERELNRTTYPVGRVIELKKIKNLDDEPDDEDYIPLVKAKIIDIDGRSTEHYVLSGDCAVGELVTYDYDENRTRIKERFLLKFLGYEKDVVIESFDKETRIAKVRNNSDDLELLNSTFNFNGKEIDLFGYKYILANVRTDFETGEWRFTSGNFYPKEDLVLQPGDRIAFGELNGIAIIYRGWKE